MDRAPYPARIAAGLIVTALEETRKLPALLITLPMTAVSQTLQAGMRAQQNIAELAIKGDAALEMLFDKPSEQPAWATFDDDLDSGDSGAGLNDTGLSDTGLNDITDESAGVEENRQAPPSPTSLDAEIADAAAGDHLEEKPRTKPAAPRSDAGRFALYSSAPDEVVKAAGDNGASAPTASKGSSKKAPKGSSKEASKGSDDAPEVVELLDYDTLTLAQLRARLRTVDTDDLAILLDHEQANRNRSPFVTMLQNRIAAQNKRSGEA